MSEPFLGQICLYGFNFAPRGWATCSGQILAIAQNTALFSLLGTMYGGNGQTTFALPDLRGRTALSFGQGPGLANYTQGEVAGTESTTLSVGNLAQHNHGTTIPANASDGTTAEPAANTFVGQPTQGNLYTTGGPGVQMGGSPTGIAGSNQPFSNMQPFLVLNYCIALEGIYPSRN